MIERIISDDKIAAAKQVWNQARSLRESCPARYTWRPDSTTRWCGYLAQTELPAWIRDVSTIDASLINANPKFNPDVRVAGVEIEVKNCSLTCRPDPEVHQVIVDEPILEKYDEYFFTFYWPQKRILTLAGGLDRKSLIDKCDVYREGDMHLPGVKVKAGEVKYQTYAKNLDDPYDWLERFGQVDRFLEATQFAFDLSL
jgi:hypothetical protein